MDIQDYYYYVIHQIGICYVNQASGMVKLMILLEYHDYVILSSFSILCMNLNMNQTSFIETGYIRNSALFFAV